MYVCECVCEEERKQILFLRLSLPLWSCTDSGVVSGFILTMVNSAKTNKQICAGITLSIGLITQTLLNSVMSNVICNISGSIRTKQNKTKSLNIVN